MPLLPPPRSPRALTNLAILEQSLTTLGYPPPEQWERHTTGWPPILWQSITEQAARMGRERNPSALLVPLVAGLVMAAPNRVSRRDFLPGKRGDEEWSAYNRAKGRLGRQLVAQAHAFPSEARVVSGPTPLESTELGLPANLPAGCGGVDMFVVVPPSHAGHGGRVVALVVAVRTTTGSSPAEWHVRPEAIATADVARERQIPAHLLRILLVEDPPRDIVTPRGLLAAAHRAYVIPFQYEIQTWLYPDEVERVGGEAVAGRLVYRPKPGLLP